VIPRWALAAVIAAAPACATEYDVDVYLVLPARCAEVGAARAAIAVDTADGETFTVDAPTCSDRLAGQEASGFFATLERLGSDYHRADVVIEDTGGGAIGGRSLPFPGDQALVLPLARADLPGWPTASIVVTIPACVAGGEIAELRLTATAAGGFAPEVDDMIECNAATPSPIVLELPRGPAALVAEAPCWRGTADTIVGDGGEVALELTSRSCL
jgi:hypothetical protein